MKSEKTISATVAARTFADLLNRVEYRGESFTVVRSGRPVCQIRPAAPARCTVADLAEFLKSAPRVDEAYLDSVEEAVKRQGPVPRSPWDS